MNSLFFVVSKLIGALIRPETLFILLLGVIFSALHRGRTSFARRTLGLTLFGAIIVGILPVGELLLAPLEARYPDNPKLAGVSTIVVLGGAEEPAYSARWRQPNVNDAGDRYLAALSLARRFPKAQILFAGGSGSLTGSAISEASIATDIFLGDGIAQARLRLEDASRNTAENAALLRKLVRRQPEGQSVLVTSAFHMPRAMATFCAAGWTNLTAWPTDYRSGNFADGIGWHFADNLASLNTGTREWIGLFAYWLTGRTQQLMGAGCNKVAQEGPQRQPVTSPNNKSSLQRKAPPKT